MNWSSIFSYDRISGVLTWTASRPGPRSPGNRAGHMSHGYLRVSVGGKGYAVHRIAWEIVNGPIPPGMEIDHIDGCRSNNAIANLRLVTTAENMKNKASHRSSKTGQMGINQHGRGFKVTCGGKYVGWFGDMQSAIEARQAAKAKHGYHPNHGRTSP